MVALAPGPVQPLPCRPSISEKADAVDAGDYKSLEINVRVVKGSTGAGTIEFEHAAVNEDSFFEGFATAVTADVDTAAAANQALTVSKSLRYVRWTTNGNAAGASVIVDVIGKNP